jgi:hypothetical protein
MRERLDVQNRDTDAFLDQAQNNLLSNPRAAAGHDRDLPAPHPIVLVDSPLPAIQRPLIEPVVDADPYRRDVEIVQRLDEAPNRRLRQARAQQLQQWEPDALGSLRQEEVQRPHDQRVERHVLDPADRAGSHAAGIGRVVTSVVVRTWATKEKYR